MAAIYRFTASLLHRSTLFRRGFLFRRRAVDRALGAGALGVGGLVDFQDDAVVLDFHDAAEEAADRLHLVALLQLRQHVLALVLLALLGAHGEEQEQRDEED